MAEMYEVEIASRERPGQVSVVMTVFNAEPYLAEAIESILNQTYSHLELIIVDDGSVDASVEVARGYTEDQRVTVVSNPVNSGTATVANQGLAMACGEFIARMGADDWAAPDRLAKHVAFLRRHPEVDVVGGALRCMALDGELLDEYLVRAPDHDTIVVRLLVEGCSMTDGTILARRRSFMPYPEMFPAEDYALWCALAAHGRTFANTDDVVLDYRVGSGVSSTLATEQSAKAGQVQRAFLMTMATLHRQSGIDDLELKGGSPFVAPEGGWTMTSQTARVKDLCRLIADPPIHQTGVDVFRSVAVATLRRILGPQRVRVRPGALWDAREWLSAGQIWRSAIRSLTPWPDRVLDWVRRA